VTAEKLAEGSSCSDPNKQMLAFHTSTAGKEIAAQSMYLALAVVAAVEAAAIVAVATADYTSDLAVVAGNPGADFAGPGPGPDPDPEFDLESDRDFDSDLGPDPELDPGPDAAGSFDSFVNAAAYRWPASLPA
jgi:hypothetical protein